MRTIKLVVLFVPLLLGCTILELGNKSFSYSLVYTIEVINPSDDTIDISYTITNWNYQYLGERYNLFDNTSTPDRNEDYTIAPRDTFTILIKYNWEKKDSDDEEYVWPTDFGDILVRYLTDSSCNELEIRIPFDSIPNVEYFRAYGYLLQSYHSDLKSSFEIPDYCSNTEYYSCKQCQSGLYTPGF